MIEHIVKMDALTF